MTICFSAFAEPLRRYPKFRWLLGASAEAVRSPCIRLKFSEKYRYQFLLPFRGTLGATVDTEMMRLRRPT
jgi:hypothetical protein